MSLIDLPGSPATESTTADRRATWLELFFDLVFAAAISEVGSSLAGDYRWERLITVGFLFFLFWWAWVGHTLFSTRFDSDDVAHRLLTLGQMFAVAVTDGDRLDRRRPPRAQASSSGRAVLIQPVRVSLDSLGSAAHAVVTAGLPVRRRREPDRSD